MPKRAAIDDYKGPWTAGIDLSAWQHEVDYNRVARSDLMIGERGRAQSYGQPRFCIVRAADGVQTRHDSAPDPLAVRHLVGCHEAGLLVDVYVYVRAFHPAAAQVDLVLEVIRVAGVPIRTVWLDVEGRPDDPTTPDVDESKGLFWTPEPEKPKDGEEEPEREVVDRFEALERLREMRDLLEAAGYRVGVYTGQTWNWVYGAHGIDVSDFARHPFWTPWYTHSFLPRLPVGPAGEPWPWPRADIWQKGGSKKVPGRIAGISGLVDANLYRGDEEALRKFWLAETPAERPTLPGPTLREEFVDEMNR